MKYLSESRAQTQEIAQAFLESINLGEKATVIALQGDLGAGKTAFSQEVGKLLGITENMHSPTFVIEKIYSIDWKGFKNLIHIDAYRLERESELMTLGWEKVVSEPENLIFIEWPENVSGLIPENSRRIFFQFIDENTREINYES